MSCDRICGPTMFHPLLYGFYSFANFLILTHINMSHVSWVLIFGSSLTHVSSQARRVSFEWTRIKCPYHLCRSPAIQKSQRSCSRDWNIWDQEKWNPHEFSSLAGDSWAHLVPLWWQRGALDNPPSPLAFQKQHRKSLYTGSRISVTSFQHVPSSEFPTCAMVKTW